MWWIKVHLALLEAIIVVVVVVVVPVLVVRRDSFKKNYETYNRSASVYQVT